MDRMMIYIELRCLITLRQKICQVFNRGYRAMMFPGLVIGRYLAETDSVRSNALRLVRNSAQQSTNPVTELIRNPLAEPLNSIRPPFDSCQKNKGPIRRFHLNSFSRKNFGFSLTFTLIIQGK